MITSILVTDGGPHPAEKWAEATASHIVQIGEHVVGAELARARRFELTVMDILEGHHDCVQTGERGTLGSVGHDRLLHPFDCCEHVSVEDAVVQIIAASAGTSFAHHFSTDEVRTYLTELLTSHFHTSMSIERSWHAGCNPETPQAQAFLATFHPGEAATTQTGA